MMLLVQMFRETADRHINKINFIYLDVRLVLLITSGYIALLLL